MAKADSTVAAPSTSPAAAAPVADRPSPRLGEVITVKVGEGLSLLNNETGQDFLPDTETSQTVSVVTLRRLQDGDLVRI
jgi:hypothetical protein